MRAKLTRNFFFRARLQDNLGGTAIQPCVIRIGVQRAILILMSATHVMHGDPLVTRNGVVKSVSNLIKPRPRPLSCLNRGKDSRRCIVGECSQLFFSFFSPPFSCTLFAPNVYRGCSPFNVLRFLFSKINFMQEKYTLCRRVAEREIFSSPRYFSPFIFSFSASDTYKCLNTVRCVETLSARRVRGNGIGSLK